MDRQAHDYAAAAAYAQQKAAAVAQAHAHQFPGAGAAAAAAAAVPGLPGFQQQFPHGQMHYLPPHHHLHPPMAHHHPSLQQQQFPPQFAHHQMQQQQQQQQQHALHQYPPFQHLAQPQPQPQPQPQQIAFFGAWEQAPPPVPPPADPELQKRIDKLAEYAAKNGPEFEEKVRNEQQDNPAYSFLFGADGHAYYRYRLWLLSRSMSSAGYMAAAAAAPPPALNPVPSLHSLNPNPSPPLNPPPLHGSPIPLPHGAAYAGSSSSFYDQPQIHPPQQPLPQHQQQPPPPVYGQTRADYEMPAKSFKGLSGPLPSDVAAELNNVVVNLTGTKESIKGAKTWFMQRSPFAPALAEALKGRVMALDDADKQLHIIYLANDILFDSLQRRSNPKDLDNEALAFQPVLGPMLAKIYHNPQNKDSNQSRLQKILQFWGSKEVYDAETIYNLEGEMIAGPPGGYGPAKDSVVKEPPMSGSTGIPSSATQNSQWHMESQRVPSVEKEQQDKTISSSSQFLGSSASIPPVYPSAAQPFHASVPSAAVPQQSSQLPGFSAGRSETQPPYPLFPPGLIPGMVRKMQIGSGVPYSPLSPLDIPSVIPPSTSSPTYILERVSKFFKEIGEVNPLEGQNTLPDPIVEEEEREPPIRTGGACIPPPPTLQVDPERGMLPDGSVEHRSGASSSGRLGLGASADPNEVSQYDDVYTSYRKQRSSSYHTSMSARASAR